MSMCRQFWGSERQGHDKSLVGHHKSQKTQPEHLHVGWQESQQVSLSLRCAAADTQGCMQSCRRDHLLIMYECSCPNKNSAVAPRTKGSYLMYLQRNIRPPFDKASQNRKSVLTGPKFSETFLVLLFDSEVKTFFISISNQM